MRLKCVCRSAWRQDVRLEKNRGGLSAPAAWLCLPSSRPAASVDRRRGPHPAASRLIHPDPYECDSRVAARGRGGVAFQQRQQQVPRRGVIEVVAGRGVFGRAIPRRSGEIGFVVRGNSGRGALAKFFPRPACPDTCRFRPNSERSTPGFHANSITARVVIATGRTLAVFTSSQRVAPALAARPSSRWMRSSGIISL